MHACYNPKCGYYNIDLQQDAQVFRVAVLDRPSGIYRDTVSELEFLHNYKDIKRHRILIKEAPWELYLCDICYEIYTIIVPPKA